MYSVPCTGYPGGYAVSRGPSIFQEFLSKKFSILKNNPVFNDLLLIHLILY